MARSPSSPRRRTRWSALLVAASLVGALLGAGSALTAASPAVALPPGTQVGAPPQVGAQWHGAWAEETDASRTAVLDKLAANKAQWVRLDVAWSTIQPNRGSYDMSWGVPFVDSLIRSARARGLRVMVTFWRTPSWANGGRGATVAPDRPQDYADALAWAAKRWSGQVEAWEVWNEPNLHDFWSTEDPVSYTALLKAAYRTTKAAVPSATIVFGGTMYVDTDWIRRAYTAGAGGSFDVMAVHPYPGRSDLPPEADDRDDRTRMMHTDELVALMRSKGDGAKPIWFTEFGWSVHSNTSSTPVWLRGVTEAQQADYLRRTVELVRSRWPQVTVLFWYLARDKATGRVHTDNRGLMRRDYSGRPVLTTMRNLSTSTAAPAATVLLAAGSTWSYRDDGVELGSTWRSPSYDVSAWRRGAARLGYGDTQRTVLAAGRTAYALRTSFSVTNPTATSTLRLRTTYDDGVVVWLNGTEVWRANVPTGTVDFRTRASTARTGASETSWHTATVPAGALRSGTNVLAVSVHNAATTSTDIGFDLELAR